MSEIYLVGSRDEPIEEWATSVCGDCTFWILFKKSPIVREPDIGLCRKNPPTSMDQMVPVPVRGQPGKVQMQSATSTKYPLVADKYPACSRFKRRPASWKFQENLPPQKTQEPEHKLRLGKIPEGFFDPSKKQ